MEFLVILVKRDYEWIRGDNYMIGKIIVLVLRLNEDLVRFIIVFIKL